MKQVLLSATANGTDYVTIKFLNQGKTVGSFNCSVFKAKEIAEHGFLNNELGIQAVKEYIKIQTPEKILKDSEEREKRKRESKGQSKAQSLKF